MKALIQRYSQQQVGRFMTIALLPFLALGSAGLFFSGLIVYPLIVTIPLYAAGLYLYVGYVRIGWFKLDYDKAYKIWNRTVFYNGFLAFCTLFIIGWMLIERKDNSSFWEVFAMVLAVFAGQITVALSAYFVRDNQNEELNQFNSKIAEIGD